MRHALLALTIAAGLAGCASTPNATTQDHPGQHSAAEIGSLQWLSGTWSGPQWGGTFTAHYGEPSGGKLISFSELSTNGEVSFYEFEVFSETTMGITLQPYPGGRRVNGFTLSSVDQSERVAIFENPAKDFPTRITYAVTAEDVLEITLDDPHGGSGKVESFVLRRVAGR